MESNIFFVPDRSRFEWEIDGHLALAEFILENGTITFTHTEVPKALGGRGIGSKLAAFVTSYAQNQGWKIIPQCPFIKAYLEKHPM